MSVKTVCQSNFTQEVLGAEIPVLLEFWAPWCGPCRSTAPILEQIAQERRDISVCKVNVDEEMTLSRQFHVMSVPTFLLIRDGKPIKRTAGALSKPQLLEFLSL